ncbi:unnamed protein product [Paramecium octaurelia]|uniref:Protein translocase subunit SecA n=1 Tax=Paramecium octaurelia TaxID=43137 RepID=A0A8S1TW09_PAROT|nr:unnamed protein product [Paramecium octaurelia]
MIQKESINTDKISSRNQFCNQENGKRSLSHYKSFDQKKVLSEIQEYYQNKQSLQGILKELLHVSHEMPLPDEYLDHILGQLQLEIKDQIELLTYCQILRLSIQKGAKINIQRLINVFNVVRDNDSLIELVRVFSIMLDRRQQKEEDLNQIFNQILNFNNLNVEIKKSINQLKYTLIPQSNSSNQQQHLFQEQKGCYNQLIATVDCHVDHERVQDSEQEQEKARSIFCDDNQALTSQIQVEEENTQITDIKKLTLFKSTYETVKQIYEYACKNKQIEDVDKDEYLPNKLLDQKYFSQGILGEFICDRMIIETFLIISRKQQLNEKTIQKVFQLCKGIDEVKGLFLKNQSESVYVNSLHRSEFQGENLNDIEKASKKILQIFFNYNEFHSKLSTNHSGLFGNSQLTCFKQKNQQVIDDVMKVMLRYFQEIRVSALQIIYNLINYKKHGLSHEQIQFIVDLQEKNEENVSFREEALKIYLSTIDEKQSNDALKVCINKLEKNHFEGIEYILNQSLCKVRANQLSGANIKMIINKIATDQLPITIVIRQKLTQIVQNFLSHLKLNIEEEDFEKLFNLLLKTTEKENEKQLQFNLLQSIIYFLRCNPTRQEVKYKDLMKQLDKFEEQLQNLIILSLGTILRMNQNQPPIEIEISDFLSNKLLLSYKINPQGIKEDNDSKYKSISYIVAEIIYYQVLKSKIQLSENTISNLIKIINNQDKELQLLSVKILNKLEKISKENCDNLIPQLFSILKDDYKRQEQLIYQSLYTKVILIIQSKGSIDLKYIELLAQICSLDYFVENAVYKQIQNNILTILKNVLKIKEKIPIQFMKMFENILINELQSQQDVIEILKELTKYQIIPNNVVAALEIQLNKLEIPKDFFQILEQVIRNGQKVGDSTLQKYIDQISNSEKDSDVCFDILEIAETNHTLSEHIFTSIQLERAGKAIKNKQDDYTDAIEYIYQKVQVGYKLSKNIFEIIANTLDEAKDKLIKILECASSNEQIIPNIVVKKLQEILNKQDIDKNVMRIFMNMLKNKQELSGDLILKLEEMLDCQTISELIVQFFAIPSQNCKLFSSQLIEKLCKHIQNTNDLNLELCLLQAINTKINANNSFHQDITHIYRVNEVLISKLQVSKQTLLPLCLQITNYIQFHTNILDPKIQEILTTLLYEKQIQYEIKKEISKILKLCKLDAQTSQFIKQFNFTQDSIDKNSDDVNQQIELLPETLDQIILIFQDYKNQEQQQKAISLLNQCKNKDQIPFELIQIIVICITQEDLKPYCFKLLNQIVESNKSIPSAILKFLIDHYADDLECASFQSIENEILTQNLSIIKQLDAKKQAQNSECSINLLNSINQSLKTGFFLLSKQRTQIICTLFATTDINLKLLYIYSKILSKLVINQLNFDENIILEIEKLIQRNDIKLTTKLIQAYTKIIEEKKYKDLQNCIDSLLKRNLEKKYMLALHECVSYACQFGNQLKKTWLPILEHNLIQQPIISNLSFKGLRAAAIDKKLNSDFFKKYCDIIIEVLKIVKNEIKEDYDLFETINYLSQYDLAKIFESSEDNWHRELLEGGFEIKNKGCETKKIKEIIQDDEIISTYYIQFLKTITQFEGLSQTQFNDLIIFVKTIGLQETNQLLKKNILYDYKKYQIKVPWLKVVQGWLRKLMVSKITNTTQFNPYIENLISLICNEKQELQIREIDDLYKFQSLLTFIIQNKCIIENSQNQYTIEELQQQFEIEVLILRFPQHKTDKQLKNIIKQLLMKGWTFQKQREILNMPQLAQLCSQGDKHLVKFFKTLYYYQVSPNADLSKIFDKQYEIWSQEVQKLILGGIEGNPGEKSIQKLVNELVELNCSNLKNDKQFYIEKINQIQTLCEEKKRQTEQEIGEWVTMAKNQESENFKDINFIVELLAVIKYAIHKIKGVELNCTQIMTALIILQQGKDEGILCQVRTGEGKSIIISIIAIFYGLQGKKINIHTSSPILAERDSKSMKSLYEFFGLNCAENGDKTKHHHSQLNTMGDRKLEIAIVDEVDSMLIDESSKFARLSSTVAGIEHFQPIYILIWQRIKQLEEQIANLKSTFYYENGKIVQQKESKNQFPLDSQSIDNFEQLKQMIGLKTTQDFDEFIAEHLKNYINGILEKEDFIILPNYFKQYFDLQFPNWICSALQAIKLEENVHYVISDGEIKPVDFKNTGIIQNSSFWGNGLHQFLQIKHNLKITPESFLTNFLSNVGYFKKYEQRIFGLTGTLGSQKTKEILQQVYGLTSVIIPQNNPKLFIELPFVVVDDDKKWLKKIIALAKRECLNKRGVLIICETILDARKIHKQLLSENYSSNKIKLYDMNNKCLENEIDVIKPEQIFVATNLAGRGTDINSTNIQKYGGLHVILTFMPTNQRVEEQAFGRTARQGNKGTGQMILNKQHLRHLICNEEDYSQLKIKREEAEAKILQKYVDQNLEEIKLKEKLFENFCNILSVQKKNNTSLGKLALHYKILSIEEKWAIFLLQNKDMRDDVAEKFDKFQNEIEKLCEKQEIICNPYYKIDIQHNQIKKNKLQAKLDALNEIIKVEGKSFASVYQEIAFLYLYQKNQDKNKALKYFQKAVELLSKEYALWQSLFVSLSKYLKNFQGSDLQKQIQQKLQIIGICANSIEENKKVIQKSQRLIDIVVQQEFKQEKIQTKTINIGYENQIAIKLCLNQQDTMYNLIFNDLSYYQDYINQDSVIKTIEQIYENSKPIDKEITIQINEIMSSKFNFFFYQKALKQGCFFDKKKASKKLENNERDTITISSILLKSSQNKFESLTIQEAKERVKKVNETYFDMIIINNKLQQWQTELLKNIQVDIEFINLDKQNIEQDLQIIKPESIDLVITSDIEDIKKILDLEFVQRVKHLKKELHISYTKERAKNHIFKSSENKCTQTISISIITEEQFKEVLGKCKEEARFNLQLNQIQGICWMKEDLFINLRFRVKDHKWIKYLIRKLRQIQLEFQLIFNNLDYNQAKQYIQKADIQQQDVKVVNRKKLKEFLNSQNQSDQQEFQNFEARGFKDIITLNEIKFFPFYNMLILGTIAFSQLIVGGVLVSTGLGSILGKMIIQEGISDVISLITSCYRREFSWSDYCYQKSACLLCTVLTFGLNAIKNTSKAKELIQSFGKCGSINLSFMIKQTWKLSFESFVIKGSNLILTKIISMKLQDSQAQLQRYLFNFIQEKFSQKDTIKLLRKFEVLSQIKNENFNENILKFSAELITRIGLMNQVICLLQNLIINSTIPANLGFESWILYSISKLLQVATLVLTQNELINYLHSKFKKLLISYANQEYNLQIVYKQWCSNKNITQDTEIKTITQVNEFLGTQADTQDEIEQNTFYKLNEQLRSDLIQNKTSQQLLDFFSDLTERETTLEDESYLQIITDLAQQLTIQISHLVEQQILLPWISSATFQFSEILISNFSNHDIKEDKLEVMQHNQNDQKKKEENEAIITQQTLNQNLEKEQLNDSKNHTLMRAADNQDRIKGNDQNLNHFEKGYMNTQQKIFENYIFQILQKEQIQNYQNEDEDPFYKKTWFISTATVVGSLPLLIYVAKTFYKSNKNHEFLSN